MNMDNKNIDVRGLGRTIVKWCLLLVYIALLMYIVLFAEFMGRTEGYATYQYNFTPFSEIKRFMPYIGMTNRLGLYAFLNIFGNVIIFIPLGVLAPSITNNKLNMISTVALSLCLSVLIEVTQLICRIGTCDVDDCILNTIGGLIGYICYIIIRYVRHKC